MSTIYAHRYVLRSRSAANRLTDRRDFPGALLRKGQGFACLHPWPELGDLPLDDQLALLASGGASSPLIERALECLRLDGQARESGQSLFTGLPIPKSHWLWNSGIDNTEQQHSVVSKGFRAVKVKCDGSDRDVSLLERVASGLPDEVLLRPDLNAALRPETAGRWVATLSPGVRARIDFVEDPMDYAEGAWSKLAGEYGIDLALDRAAGTTNVAGGGFRWHVVKPAVDDPAQFTAGLSKGRGLIFTSYLDHPLGQVFAAYCAAREAVREIAEIGTCGLVSHLWFEPTPFSEALEIGSGGRLLAPKGTGLGFDDLLESLRWERL